MTPILLSGPAIEPVSLQEAKNWLRVEGNGDDMLIQALITSARLIVEARTATMLITQSWRCILDAWPISAIVEIPLKPLQGIDEIRTRAQNGNETVVSSDIYFLESGTRHPRLHFRQPPPPPGQAVAGIEIDLTVGFGSTDASVPAPIRQAILLLVARWYENRGDVSEDVQAPPREVASLLAPWHEARLV